MWLEAEVQARLDAERAAAETARREDEEQAQRWLEAKARRRAEVPTARQREDEVRWNADEGVRHAAELAERAEVDSAAERHLMLRPGDMATTHRRLGLPYEEELLAIFDMIDENGNGVMDFTELLDLGKGVNSSFTAAKCRAVLGRMDEDRDGTITKDEFVVFFGKIMQNYSREANDKGIIQVCLNWNKKTYGDMKSDMYAPCRSGRLPSPLR